MPIGNDPWLLLWETTFPLIALIVLISGLIWLVIWIRSRFRDDADPAETDQQMLLQIGDLRREGDLSDEEYRSIKGRLVERLDSAPAQPNSSD